MSSISAVTYEHQIKFVRTRMVQDFCTVTVRHGEPEISKGEVLKKAQITFDKRVEGNVYWVTMDEEEIEVDVRLWESVKSTETHDYEEIYNDDSKLENNI